jgi:hypothetical protein
MFRTSTGTTLSKIGKTALIVATPIISILLLILLLVWTDERTFLTPSLTQSAPTATENAQAETVVIRERYKQWAAQHTVAIHAWHIRSTKIIFWVSILVSAFGIGFSFWQFIEAGKAESSASHQDQLELKTQLVTLAFKSRSLATFMMFCSLAYLMIYITLVYPIRNETERRAPTLEAQHQTSTNQRSASEAQTRATHTDDKSENQTIHTEQ